MSKIGISSKIQRLLKESRLYCQSGRLEEAKLIYQDLLKSIPSHPEALGNLGTIELKSGNTELGVKLLKQSISVDPTQCNFLINLGNGLLDLVNPNEAFFYFETALKINPYSSELHYNRARALKLLNRNQDAIEALKSSIQCNPKNYLAYMNLGFLLNEQGQFQEAINNYNEAIEINPNNFQLFYNRGITFENLKKYEESLKDYNHSIRLNNNFGMAFFNKSGLLFKLKKFDESLIAIDQAIKINPHNWSSFIKKALIYQELKNYELAFKSYDHILEEDPNNSEAIANKSYLRLSMLDFKSGWKLYKHRWWDRVKVQLSIPEVDNFILVQKKIFIWAEQGVGDQIIFSSLFFDAFKTKNEFYISLDPRLINLFKRSFSWAKNVSFISSQGEIIESDYDFHLPMGNLGLFFRNSIEDFTSHPTAYLKPNETQVNNLKSRIKTGSHKICGISWLSKNKEIGEEKSLSLIQLLPILTIPNITFIDLQYGDTSIEKKNIYDLFGIEIKSINEIDNFNNLDGLTSLINACDFIVTTSNVTAHIAGASNKKTYLLLPHGYGKIWYWGESSERSLWYPSIEICRSPDSGLWAEAIESLSNKLRVINE
jgi:tetratricopeptide (TPR) repeat protein